MAAYTPQPADLSAVVVGGSGGNGEGENDEEYDRERGKYVEPTPSARRIDARLGLLEQTSGARYAHTSRCSVLHASTPPHPPAAHPCSPPSRPGEGGEWGSWQENRCARTSNAVVCLTRSHPRPPRSLAPLLLSDSLTHPLASLAYTRPRVLHSPLLPRILSPPPRSPRWGRKDEGGRRRGVGPDGTR